MYQSKEYVASLLSKLSRGGDVSQNEAAMASTYYKATLLELDSISYFLDLNSSTERSQNPHEKNTNDFETLHHQHEKLKKVHDELRIDHEVLLKELDYLRKKESLEGKVTVESNEKNHKEKEPRLSKAMDKLRQQNQQLIEEKDKLTAQINELRNSLSALTAQKLTGDNPGIADLSDPYRPTYLVEKFRQVYDDEWTCAYEELKDIHTFDEKSLIDFLSSIIKELDAFCGEISKQQLEQIYMSAVDEVVNPKFMLTSSRMGFVTAYLRSELDKQQTEHANMMIIDFRRFLSTLSIRPLTQIFDKSCMERLRKSVPLSGCSSDLDNFVANALEVIWMMKIQHPPMVLVWQNEGEKHDKDKFTFYTKRGEYVKQTVWPAVLLHDKGPLISKGILQGK